MLRNDVNSAGARKDLRVLGRDCVSSILAAPLRWSVTFSLGSVSLSLSISSRLTVSSFGGNTEYS